MHRPKVLLEIRHLEITNTGPEEGPLFSLIAGDYSPRLIEKFKFRVETATQQADYFTTTVLADDTNGVVVTPGDLIVISDKGGSNEIHVSVVISPNDAIKEALVERVRRECSPDGA